MPSFIQAVYLHHASQTNCFHEACGPLFLTTLGTRLPRREVVSPQHQSRTPVLQAAQLELFSQGQQNGKLVWGGTSRVTEVQLGLFLVRCCSGYLWLTHPTPCPTDPAQEHLMISCIKRTLQVCLLSALAK